MADFITKAQHEELEDSYMFGDTEEFHRLLEKYTGIEARSYTAYRYYDENGNYIGDSNESDLDELLEAAYVEVRDGWNCCLAGWIHYGFRRSLGGCRDYMLLWVAFVPGVGIV